MKFLLNNVFVLLAGAQYALLFQSGMLEVWRTVDIILVGVNERNFLVLYLGAVFIFVARCGGHWVGVIGLIPVNICPYRDVRGHVETMKTRCRADFVYE